MCCECRVYLSKYLVKIEESSCNRLTALRYFVFLKDIHYFPSITNTGSLLQQLVYRNAAISLSAAVPPLG